MADMFHIAIFDDEEYVVLSSTAIDMTEVELPVFDNEGCIVIDCMEILLLNVEVIDIERCFVFKTLVVAAWLGSKTKTSSRRYSNEYISQIALVLLMSNGWKSEEEKLVIDLPVLREFWNGNKS